MNLSDADKSALREASAIYAARHSMPIAIARRIVWDLAQSKGVALAIAAAAPHIEQAKAKRELSAVARAALASLKNKPKRL